MFDYRFIVYVLVCFLLGCVTNPSREPTVTGGVTINTERAHASIGFSDSDRAQIANYFQKQSKGKKTPPGLAKRKAPPPGHQKQLDRNGTLPPGLQGRDLPSELEQRLSELPPGYIRLRIESDIVILDQKTRVIMDVIKDIS